MSKSVFGQPFLTRSIWCPENVLKFDKFHVLKKVKVLCSGLHLTFKHNCVHSNKQHAISGRNVGQ